ncbi:hypothetical protein Poly59_01790 [Rubripirellula reticaptiva]|uniref:Uncharacterized protein n=1 Tax=Rubripirellula reticaptiva TaxID=2528013 RepID=A0A5C6F8N1_9BACT|nr:hypothetical protein Poly59_01790 [Rubripirellula reticaptiva]
MRTLPQWFRRRISEQIQRGEKIFVAAERQPKSRRQGLTFSWPDRLRLTLDRVTGDPVIASPSILPRWIVSHRQRITDSSERPIRRRQEIFIAKPGDRLDRFSKLPHPTPNRCLIPRRFQGSELFRAEVLIDRMSDRGTSWSQPNILTTTHPIPSHDHPPIPSKTTFAPPNFAYGKVRRGELAANPTSLTNVFTGETTNSFNNESDIPAQFAGSRSLL